MSGEFDSRKDSQSTKFERRPRIFVKLSFRVKVVVKELLRRVKVVVKELCFQTMFRNRC